MSLEGAIREMGLHEVGQLLSLSRKTGVLEVSSVLRGRQAWIRFANGAIVDAGDGEPLSAGASPAAVAGDRPTVEEHVLGVLVWPEGRFAFRAEPRAEPQAEPGSAVRIPTDAMLVEAVRREDAWSHLRDRVASPEVVPSFVDVEPKALPLLKLVPQEWEVLTCVDGTRDLRALAKVLERDLLEVAKVVHRLVGTGLLSVRDGMAAVRPTSDDAAGAVDGSRQPAPSPMPELPPPRIDGRTPEELAATTGLLSSDAADSDELWIPDRAELAAFTEPDTLDDAVFDPQQAGLLSDHGVPRPAPATGPGAGQTTVTLPATAGVASASVETSAPRESAVRSEEAEANARYWRSEGDAAVRRGDLDRALTCWRQCLRVAPAGPDAATVREAVALTARLQTLLTPDNRD